MLISEMPHNVCVCKYHANFDFLTQSLSSTVQEFPSTGKDLLSLVCCNIQNEKCMTGNCSECHNEVNVLVDEDDMNKCLVYKQWEEVDGFLKVVEMNSSVEDALKELNNQLTFYKVHCFVKIVQSSYFEEVKNTIVHSEIILQVDFAENYSAISQDEIQSAHWTHQQITIFTCCAWLRENVTRPFVVISDELNHDKFAVWAFLKAVMTSLKTEFPELEKVKILSDGCAAQFKSKYNLSNLCCLKSDFGVTGEWNFFATSHGKGAVDGIGGTVKSKVWTVVKSRKVVINSAGDFYQYARDITGIKSLFVSSQEVSLHKPMLTSRWERSISIEGIQSKHHFKILDDNYLLIGRTAKSALQKVAVIAYYASENVTNSQSLKKSDDLVVGDFVLVSLAIASSSKKQSNGSKLYYATVLAVDHKNEELILKYMHATGSYWIWPEKDDVSCESYSVIVKKVSPPSLLSNRGYHYTF